ncbi:MAG: nucleoside recognition protein [Ruminococcus sp.]|nr:nucleoside recognition protein [Ruminococcus sp.]
MKKIIRELTGYLAAGLTVWLCILIIAEGDNVFNEITKAIKRCLNVIIPSLFAFMAISGIIINTKIYQYISKPFYPITKYIFKMPNNLFFVFLLGNISGYPVGAKLLVELKEQNIIDKKTAEVMSCFCYGGGPAFFTGVIGLTIYNNTKIGVIIFLSVFISNLFIGIVMCRIFKPTYIETKEKIVFNSNNIIQAVISTGKSLFTICTTILFFAVFMSLLNSESIFNFIKQIGLSEDIFTLIKSLFEISNISELSSKSFNTIPLIAGICSFGGLCILMQLKVIVGNTYSLKLFFCSRIIGSVLSITICQIILKLFHDKIITASSEKIVLSFVPNNFIPSICLIAMIFIIMLRDKINFPLKRKELSSHNMKTANN